MLSYLLIFPQVIPASRRGVTGNPARPLSTLSTPLLAPTLTRILSKVRNVVHGISSVEHINVPSIPSNGIREHPLEEIESSETVMTLNENEQTARMNSSLAKKKQALESIAPDCEAWIATLTDLQDGNNDLMNEQNDHPTLSLSTMEAEENHLQNSHSLPSSTISPSYRLSEQLFEGLRERELLSSGIPRVQIPYRAR